MPSSSCTSSAGGELSFNQPPARLLPAHEGVVMTGTLVPEVRTDAPLTIGGRSFRSRLMVGTGKYRDHGVMTRAIETSGAEIVTVAVRRVDLDRTKEEGMLYHLSTDDYFLLANTAGCYTADEAVRYARLAREAGFNEFIKLEV